jgi:hypothetical protein
VPRPPRPFAALAFTLAAAGARPLAAQTPARAAARTVAGEVVQAESGGPLEGATVVLTPAALGALGGGPGRGAFVAGSRTAVTGAAGRYHFADVALGAYVLRVHRLGYRPATVEVELRGDGAGASRVSVGLTVVPIRLRAVEVGASPAEPFARHARTARAAGDARAAALRLRQSRYLATDVREVTQADVAEGVTLGETDLFRALQRLPGVSTRNDLTAELWTRGARWDQTRVTFDGLPLFNPVHVAGLLSAVNADAVGAAFLHPGVRPAALGEGSAAVLDLRSRAGGGGGALRGVGEVSLLSARATLDQRVAGGRGAWMLSARRSYADWAVPAIARRFGEDPAEARFPYHFAELAGRVDWRLGRGHALEVSALRSQDHFTGDLADVVQGTRARWGNTVARATLAGPARVGALGVVAVRHTLGVSAYEGRVREVPVDPALADRYGDDRMTPVRADVRYLLLAGEVAPDGAGAPAWGAGYELSAQRARTEGALRAAYALDLADSTAGRVAGGATQLAVWAERRLRPAPRVTVAAGVRVEGGPPLPGGGPLAALRLAPRVTARYAVGDSQTFVSAGAGRNFQYAQAVSVAQLPGVTPLNLTGPIPLWVAPGSAWGGVTTPALRTDLATVGVERWLGAGWHAAANAYVRRADGLVLGDPRPGPVDGGALFVTGGERARGAELGVRKLTGRWTLAGSYAVARARTRAAGLTFASTQDQRHVFGATAMWRAKDGLRLGAAYSAFSGAPFTRGRASLLGRITGYTTRDGRVVPDSTTYRPGFRGPPSAGRYPTFARMDVLLDWSGRVGPVRAGAYLQVHNALFRRNNPLGLISPECFPDAGGATSCRDRVESSFPIAPVIGVRLSF